MDQEQKEKLGQMIDSMIKNNSEESQIIFHDYLQPRMKEVIHGREETESGNTDED